MLRELLTGLALVAWNQLAASDRFALDNPRFAKTLSDVHPNQRHHLIADAVAVRRLVLSRPLPRGAWRLPPAFSDG